jgi:two-component SAPR family response regulator
VCIYPFSGAGALINYMDSTYFDVIFLDIDMPEITGFDAAKKVKEISPESKIIFVTSKHDLVYNSFEYQPFYFIRKP